MASIIIPAHNEAAVIESTLDAVLAQLGSDDEVIVVCNGCTDDTFAVVKRYAPAVKALETPVPSKTGALNLGDCAAVQYPRIYLDADIVLAPGALSGLKQSLESRRWLATAPAPVMDVAQCSWAVRAYYDIWLALPYCRNGMMGAGVYALSQEGRSRFRDFPSLIADDGYVRALFKEHERGRADGAHAIVRAPATLKWLLKIKTRSRLGGMELKLKCPELMGNEVKNYASALREVLFRPARWGKFLVYAYVNFFSRILARRQLKDISAYRWEKDVSTRVTPR